MGRQEGDLGSQEGNLGNQKDDPVMHPGGGKRHVPARLHRADGKAEVVACDGRALLPQIRDRKLQLEAVICLTGVNRIR